LGESFRSLSSRKGEIKGSWSEECRVNGVAGDEPKRKQHKKPKQTVSKTGGSQQTSRNILRTPEGREGEKDM